MFVSQYNLKHSFKSHPAWTEVAHPSWVQLKHQTNKNKYKTNEQKRLRPNVICHMCYRWYLLEEAMVLGAFFDGHTASLWGTDHVSETETFFRFSQDQCRQCHHTKDPLEFLNDRRCYQAPWKLLWPCQHQSPRLIQLQPCTVTLFCPPFFHVQLSEVSWKYGNQFRFSWQIIRKNYQEKRLLQYPEILS